MRKKLRLTIAVKCCRCRSYRARAVREPRAVLAEFGLALKDDVSVAVHDSTADMRYLVLPERPAGTEVRLMPSIVLSFVEPKLCLVLSSRSACLSNHVMRAPWVTCRDGTRKSWPNL